MNTINIVCASICALFLTISPVSLLANESPSNSTELEGYVFIIDHEAREHEESEDHQENEEDGDQNHQGHKPILKLNDVDNRMWFLEYEEAIELELISAVGEHVTLLGQKELKAGGAYFIVDQMSKGGEVQSYAPQTIVNPITGDITYAVLMCQYSDTSENFFNSQQYNDIFSTDFPGVNHFYDTISYDNVNLGAETFGPYTLPFPRSYYQNPQPGFTSYNLFLEDCVNAADADVLFPDFEGILTIPSESYETAWAGLGTLGETYLNIDGSFNPYRVTWLQRSGINQNVITHEIGHNLTWPHSSGPYNSIYDSRWDLMSGGYYFDAAYQSVYGFIASDTIAYHKEIVGWIPQNKIFNYNGFGAQDLTIESHGKASSDWDANSYLSLKVPHSETNSFYTVEARFTEGYDQDLPGTGLVIHLIEENSFGGTATVYDATQNGNTNDDGSYLVVGETFSHSDLNYDLEVLAIDNINKSFDVRLSSSNPVVSVTPLTEEYYDVEEPILFQASATDNGSIANVRFEITPQFSSTNLAVFDDATAPYSASWTPQNAGMYKVNATATDDQGNVSVSDFIEFEVQDPLNNWSEWVNDTLIRTNFAIVIAEYQGQLFQSYIGLDNRIYTRFSSSTDPENMTWSSFETSTNPGEFTDKPISMVASDGVLYQTHVGRQGRIYTRSSTDGIVWSNWFRDESKPGEFTAYPVYQTDANNKLYQTHVGRQGKIYTRSSNDGINWSDWSRDITKPGEFTAYPVSMTSIGSDIYQVHVGRQGRIFTRSSGDGVNWNDWSLSAASPFENTRSAVSIVNNNGIIVQAHKGLQGQILTRYSFDETETWTRWYQFAENITTGASINMAIYDNTMWQVVNTNGYILHRKFIGTLE